MTVTDANDLISSTISSVQAAKEGYDKVNDDESLLETFHEAGSGLRLVNEALMRIAAAQLPTKKATTASLESCHTDSKSSEAVFTAMSKASSGTELQQAYIDFIEQKGKEYLVEILVGNMMKNVCVLAKDYGMEEGMKEQLTKLYDAMKRLADMDSSVPTRRNEGRYSFSNNGSGSQYNSAGGTQNNATGNAKQFIKSTFQHEVNFY